jgi:hypothetical protein
MRYVKKVAIALLLLAASLASSCTAFADEIPLGSFAGATYFFDSEAIIKKGNFVSAWIISHSQEFNITKNPNYSRAAGLFTVDCENGTAAFLAVVVFSKDNNVLTHDVVSEDKITFIPIRDHTASAALYRALCVEAIQL